MFDIYVGKGFTGIFHIPFYCILEGVNFLFLASGQSTDQRQSLSDTHSTICSPNCSTRDDVMSIDFINMISLIFRHI